MNRTKLPVLALVLALVAGHPAWAQQSNNNRLHLVPPPGKVVVDGKLDDWDLSGQFEVFANLRTKSTYSTKVAGMWDQEYLYLAVV